MRGGGRAGAPRGARRPARHLRQVHRSRDPGRDRLRVRRVGTFEGGPVRRAEERQHAQRPAPAPEHRAERVRRVPGPAALLGPGRRRGGLGPGARTHSAGALDGLEGRVAGGVPGGDGASGDQQARAGRVERCGGRPDQALARHQIDQDVIGEPGQREVQQGGRRLHRVLVLAGRTRGPVQLARPEPQPVRLLLREPGGGDVLEQPPHPERNRFLRQRGGQSQESAAPAPPPLALGRPQRHPQLGRGARGPFGEHMVQGGLQLLDALDHQFAERAAEEGGAAPAERAGGVRVDDRGPQVDVDEDHTPGRVLQQRLAQGDGPLQVDLGVHLAERAVDPGRLPVGAAHPGGLGPHQHPAAVLAQQRELVHLPPRRVHGRHQPGPHLVRVGPPHRPAREAAAADGLVRRPAEDAFGLAVPVGDRAGRVERAERGVHAVEQRRQQLGPVGRTGSLVRAGPAPGSVEYPAGPPPESSSGPSSSVAPLLLGTPTPHPPQNVSAVLPRVTACIAARQTIQLERDPAHIHFAQIFWPGPAIKSVVRRSGALVGCGAHRKGGVPEVISLRTREVAAG